MGVRVPGPAARRSPNFLVRIDLLFIYFDLFIAAAFLAFACSISCILYNNTLCFLLIAYSTYLIHIYVAFYAYYIIYRCKSQVFIEHKLVNFFVKILCSISALYIYIIYIVVDISTNCRLLFILQCLFFNYYLMFIFRNI